jgi:vacuolar-type H+-ATPase subunit H
MAEKTNELRERAAAYTASPTVSSNEPEGIRAQIKQTRAQMGHTIDEIQARLSPEHIKQQTQEAIREATIGKVEKMANQVENKVSNWRTNTMATIRENPIPMALIGIGVGWLLLKDNNGHDEFYYGQQSFPYDSRYRYSYNPEEDRSFAHEGAELMDRTRERVADAAQGAREWVDEKVDTVEDKVTEVAQQARQKKDEIAQTLREQADTRAEQAQHAAHYMERRARRQVGRVRHTFWDTLDENPLALGIVAMAAGAIAGLALPGTAMEDRYMGEMRDNLLEEARTTAQQTARKVQTVAEQVQQTALEEAKREAERQDLLTPEPEPNVSSMEKPVRTPTAPRTDY